MGIHEYASKRVKRFKEGWKHNWKMRIGLMGGLACFYTLNGISRPDETLRKDYFLPEKIAVVDTNLPYEMEGEDGLEKYVYTDNVDFSQDFYLETERYRIEKDKDWAPTRALGHVGSLPMKLMFWDWNIGLGLDEKRSRAVVSILENNKEIDNITVRINHNKFFKDMYRLFRDDRVAERNSWLARGTVGVLFTFPELFAELRRGDYYNPMTQTAIVYSNLESISGHEIGHHQDFQRFDSDWAYGLSRSFPPAMLYQEWQASQNSLQSLEAPDHWQFSRFLLPAFFTYCMGSYFGSKVLLQKQAFGAMRGERIQEELNGVEGSKEQRNEIIAKYQGEFVEMVKQAKFGVTMPQVFRHMGTTNASLYGGIGSYMAVAALGAPALLTYAGFAGGMWATTKVVNNIWGESVPYQHETIARANTEKKKEKKNL